LKSVKTLLIVGYSATFYSLQLFVIRTATAYYALPHRKKASVCQSVSLLCQSPTLPFLIRRHRNLCLFRYFYYATYQRQFNVIRTRTKLNGVTKKANHSWCIHRLNWQERAQLKLQDRHVTESNFDYYKSNK